MRQVGSPDMDLDFEVSKSEAISPEFDSCGRREFLLVYRVQALLPDFLYSESYPDSLHFPDANVIVAPIIEARRFRV